MKQTAETDRQPEQEGVWPLAPPSQSDLPDGEYIAAFRDAQRAQWFCQEKIRLRFEIIEPAIYAGIQVYLFSTLPKHLSHRCKYYALWVKANGGLPHRNDRMSPRVFHGYWKIRVAWSVPQNDGYPMPQVVELIERVAGARAR